MEITELFGQNPWWKDKSLIDKDYDIVKWKEKKYRWVPGIIEKISLKPFALHIITGPRQSGKTTTIKLLIKKLLDKEEPKSIFYFNCENLADYRELTEVLESYIEFKAANSIEASFIFLDEITLPKEWYRSIKYLIDKGKFTRDAVIITGSSSLSVKREVELFPGRRGKGEDFILYPLSFRGFLNVVDPGLARKLQAL
ncbi:MAG: AAA family ATPase, partial [Candidatus Aenigmarchaeota archaeon]|nr:AAA family ATPase [Candidatus Aenigmarchaeota archaeon]